MGEAGIQIVQDLLPDLIDKHEVDVVIAQSENVTDGKSMSIRDMKRLQLSGVDVFTGGNHSVERKEILPYLKSNDEPVVAPANMGANPGSGVHVFEHVAGTVVVISLMGTILPDRIEATNPFVKIDELLTDLPHLPVSIIVNMHAEFSSEKILMGQYLDGRVSAVVGDHWHVPTADARLLPKGTAHITDVGMCGAYNGSLGAESASIIEALRKNKKIHSKIEMNGPRQFCAVLIETKKRTGLSKSITQILHKQ